MVFHFQKMTEHGNDQKASLWNIVSVACSAKNDKYKRRRSKEAEEPSEDEIKYVPERIGTPRPKRMSLEMPSIHDPAYEAKIDFEEEEEVKYTPEHVEIPRATKNSQETPTICGPAREAKIDFEDEEESQSN